jgi:hypothetical protein
MESSGKKVTEITYAARTGVQFAEGFQKRSGSLD